MARIEFGHTWWGRQWLNALTEIDFENRLPRGKRYARNGSVRSINVDGNRVEARVQGREPSPYKISVEMPAFTENEKRSIISIVKESPYYLSQLEARRLPTELDAEARERGIKIFPGSWKDLSMTCSCPDWAVPCKHLAAVIYIIANEIDKSPFLVFELHGLDLLREIHGDAAADESEQIVGIDSLVARTPEVYNYFRDKLQTIDLATIPDLYPAFSQVLTEFPLFYLANDFREILLTVYKKLARSTTKHVAALDLTEDPPETLYTTCTLTIQKRGYRIVAKLQRGKRTLAADSDDASPLVEYIHHLSAGDLAAYPPVISFLVLVHSFVLRSLEARAAIPEIVALGPDRYAIRWIPGLFNAESRRVFDALVDAVPREMVRFGNAPLEHREQVLFLFSFFYTHYLRVLAPVPDVESNPILSLFFGGGDYQPKRFDERRNALTIHLWLGRFFVRPIHHYPVIEVTEYDINTFAVDIRVQDRRHEESLPESFVDFLKRPEAETLPLLRDLSLLATYLETVNDFLRQKSRVLVPTGAFVDSWFNAVPAFRTLGVHTNVPRALQQAFLPKVSLRATAIGSPDAVVSYTSLQEMLAFQWTVAIGDAFVGPEELLKLRESASRFVRYRNMFVEVDEKALESIRRRVEKPIRLSPLDVLATGLTGMFDEAPVEMGDDVRNLFTSLLEVPDVDPPDGLRASLREYQLRGYRWLYHNYRIGLGSVVADDMGLGKTLQVITFLLRLQEEGVVTPKKPALAIVPASLVTNWQRETERFAPSLRVGVYHGAARAIPEECDIIVTTYALARIDQETLAKRPWSVSIIDEAQNIKNATSSQAKAVKAIQADYAIALTGTPVENRLLDFWSIIDYCAKGYLGNRESFKRRYAAPIERYRDQEALNRFRKLTSPITLRRLKTDRSVIADLPDKVVVDRYPALTAEQASIYQELVDKVDATLDESEGIERAGIVFTLMTGLKQICCHPRLYLKRGPSGADASGKAQLLVELLTSIFAADEKALIFTQFAEMGELLTAIIEEKLGEPPLFLHGGTPRKRRDEMVDTFQGSPEHRVMILSIKAGGVGLNLTAATHVIHYDLWWNPAVENQATDRAFRIGQKRNVTVHRLISRGTFEEKINEMIAAKQELAGLTVSEGEAWLTKLNIGELRQLVALSDS